MTEFTRPSQDYDRLVFYASPLHTCSYLPGQRAVTLFADPNAPMNMELYSRLTDYGFRRSGKHVYAPRCPKCNACRPARIPARHFQLNRGQQRIVRRNRDIVVHTVRTAYRDEHFALYREYLQARHKNGGMDITDPAKYMEFVVSPWSDTLLYEFRGADKLLAVAVVDRLLHGLSAVYTFFAPEEQRRSPGTYAILWLVEEARRLDLRYVYLGYWIRECRKMRYKESYRPIEIRRDGVWCRYTAGMEIPP